MASELKLKSLSNKREFIVDKDVLIGRETECHVHIDSPQVSRYHAKIYNKNGIYFIRDLNSSNGTYVNGSQIDAERVISIGDQVAFSKEKFEIVPAVYENQETTELKTRVNIKSFKAIPEDSKNNDLIEADVLEQAASFPTNATAQKNNGDDAAKIQAVVDKGVQHHSELSAGNPERIDEQPVVHSQKQSSILKTPASTNSFEDASSAAPAHAENTNTDTTNILNMSELEALRKFTNQLTISDDSGSGARLVALTAPIRGKVFQLESKENVHTWVIGRNEHAEIDIKSQFASRIHASITKIEGVYEVSAEDAKNGLFVNAQETAGKVLKHGDLIQLGSDAFVFRTNVRQPQQSEGNQKGFKLTYFILGATVTLCLAVAAYFLVT